MYYVEKILLFTVHYYVLLFSLFYVSQGNEFYSNTELHMNNRFKTNRQRNGTNSSSPSFSVLSSRARDIQGCDELQHLPAGLFHRDPFPGRQRCHSSCGHQQPEATAKKGDAAVQDKSKFICVGCVDRNGPKLSNVSFSHQMKQISHLRKLFILVNL